ncbi:Chlorovirus glycoprotein repeat domain-containing protein, partial [Acanthocystis turfacea Chlorella virus OR0704.3]
ATFGNIANVRFARDGNVTASYYFGNGSQLTGVVATLPGTANLDILNGNITGSYANVSNINATFGNIANVRFVGGNVAVSGQVNVLGNVIASNFLGNVIGSFANIGNTQFLGGNVAVSGQVNVLGNVIAPFFIGNGSQLTGIAAALPGVIAEDIIGNLTGSFANVSNINATFGNIANVRFVGGNVAVSGQVNVLGNVIAPFFIGNGSQLTGIAAALPGVITADINGNLTGSFANVSNIVATFGNIANVMFDGGNVEVSGQVDVFGNVVANTFVGNQSVLRLDNNTHVMNLISTNVTYTSTILQLLSSPLSLPDISNLTFIECDVFNGTTSSLAPFAVWGNGSVVTTGSFSVRDPTDIAFRFNAANSGIIRSNVITTGDDVANFQAINGAFSSTMLNLQAGRSASSAFNFIRCQNGNGSTAPFVVDGAGNATAAHFLGNITGLFANIGNTRFLGGNVAASGQVNILGNIVGNTFIGNQSILKFDTTGADVANFQAINGAYASTMLTLIAGRTPSSAFNFIRCQNSNGTTLSFVVDGAGNATARHFIGNVTASVGNVGNVRFLGGNVAVSGQINVLGNVVANHFLGNVTGLFANIANVIFLGGNVAASGQVNISGNAVVASNGIMSGLYLSAAGTATSNNNIFFSSTGNINDNNVNAIGWNGTQVRHSTIGGSSGYTFTQYVASLTEQTEVANLNYFGGSAFKCNGVAAFGAQVININTGFTGTMVLTESSTASAGTFHHIRCKSTTANVFRVVGNGTTFNVNGTYTTGADYAEFFEWADGNLSKEDRRGTPVVLNGNKIRIASQSDDPYDIIGVVSTNPTIVGDSAWNEWSGVYIKDKYGQSVLKTSYYHANVSNSEEELIPCSEGDIPPEGYVIKTKNKPILNPAYDPRKPYINRIDRPEWAPIGLCGKLRVDNSFVSANIVHPSWKPLFVIDDPADSGNSAAQVVEMLIGVPFTKPDNAMKDKINSLEETVNMLKKALNM